jgi:tetratricopeptide (TPR) repeat protein
MLETPRAIGSLTRFLTSGLFFYLAIGLLLLPLFFSKEFKTAKHKTLNRLMPSYDELINLNEKNINPPEQYFRKSVHYFNAVDRDFPNRPDTVGMLGYVYYHLGEYNQSISYYKKANRILNSFFWYQYNLALLLYKQEKYSQALESLHEAVNLLPESSLKFFQFSKIYTPFWAQREEFHKYAAASLREGYRHAYILICLSYFKLNEYAKMAEVASRVLGLDLDDEGVFSYYAGIGLFSLGRLEQSAEFFKKAIEQNPNNADAYFHFAQVLEKVGRRETAAAFYKKAKIIGQSNGSVLPDPQNWDVKIY